MTTFAENSRARFDYTILESYEAGIELFGYEAKAVRAGRAGLRGAYVVPRGGELWLLNADIPPYQPKNTPVSYDPKRSRKLLLRHGEIKALQGKITAQGLTLLPLKVYSKGRRIKVEIALARHRKKEDKREHIKKREAKKTMARVLKTG